MESNRLEQGALLGGRYEITATLGQGGMGAVYRARDSRLDCTVAVKELTNRFENEEEREESFRLFEREARLLAQLAHPNLPRVSDYFVENGRRYLVMEFIEGENLETRLERDGRIPTLLALEWAVQLADALTYLHEQDPPVIFRDLKPANIMITSAGVAKLIDFGIARRYQEGASKDTLLYGNPGYSPPEQYGRTQTDPRADLYALGATMHHMVTGRDPAPNPFKFPSIRTFDPSLLPALDGFIQRCVEMDEGKRIQSARESRNALSDIRAEVRSRVQPKTDHRPVSTRRRTAISAAAVALLLIALAAASSLWIRQPRADTVTPKPPAPVPQPAPLQPAGPSEQSGSLKVDSEPTGAQVLIDGKDMGITPVELDDITPGSHKVSLVLPGSTAAEPWSREVEIQSGKTVVLDVQLPQTPAHQEQPTTGPNVEVIRLRSESIRSPNPRNLEPGIYIEAGFRISGAAGKSGSAAAYFYESDGITPLAAPDHAGPYRDKDGQLHSAASLQINADPAEFANFIISLPAWAIAPTSKPITWRFVVHVEGKQVFRSEPAPIPSGR